MSSDSKKTKYDIDHLFYRTFEHMRI